VFRIRSSTPAKSDERFHGISYSPQSNEGEGHLKYDSLLPNVELFDRLSITVEPRLSELRLTETGRRVIDKAVEGHCSQKTL
jgi:hypothetical protein